MIEILNHLWINYDLIDSSNINRLKENILSLKIKNIVIISNKIGYLNIKDTNEMMYKLSFDKNIDIQVLNNDFYKKIYEITFLINECLKKKQKIIIIGHNNNQDIDAIICAYYIRYAKVSFNKAIEYLKTKKKNVFYEECYYYDVLNLFYKDINQNNN
jgi:hypothetical protein